MNRIVMKGKKISQGWYIFLVPLFTAVAGSLLLILAMQVPKEWMRENTLISAQELVEEGVYPLVTLPSAPVPYVEDTVTEQFILQTSYTMDTVRDVFEKRTSPNVRGEADKMWILYDTVTGAVQPGAGYSRYWMGFRLWVRPLLCLLSLNGLRRLVAWGSMLLAVGVIIMLTRRNSKGTALAFALAFAMVEPYSITHSLQYFSTFFLMMLFSLLLGRSRLRLGDHETFACFCLFGAVTQFFDFYNNPLVTCLFPLLILADREEGGVKRMLVNAVKLVLAWLLSYVIMWLTGLCFVTMFTPENGLAKGLGSAMLRLGIGSYKDPQTSYSIKEALWALYWRATTRFTGDYLHPGPLAVLLAATCCLFAAARIRRGNWGRLPVYMFLGALPLVWACVTAEPTIIHVCFQYRVISALYFAVMLALADAWRGVRGKTPECVQP